MNRQEILNLLVILLLIKKSLLDSWLTVCESDSQALKCILLLPTLHQFRDQSTLTFREFYPYLGSYYWWEQMPSWRGYNINYSTCYKLVSNNIITIFPYSYEKHNVQGASYGCSQALGTFKLFFRSSTQGAWCQLNDRNLFSNPPCYGTETPYLQSLNLPASHSAPRTERYSLYAHLFLQMSFIWWPSANPVLGCIWPETTWLTETYFGLYIYKNSS